MKAKFYRCGVCGNLTALLHEGAGTMSCCGQPMTLLVAGSTDAAQEKHVPAVTREGGKLRVAVGSVEHPMSPEHWIEWIALVTGEGAQLRCLSPNDKPAAVFDDVKGTVYAYCNLHGLWAADS